MGQCIGNCIKCELVSNDEKMICCAVQTLRQTVEIKTQQRQILEKLDEISIIPEISQQLAEISDAETPAAESQEKPEKKKK